MFGAVKSLRLFAVLILGGILVACAQSDVDKEGVDLSYRVDPNQPVCAPFDNIAVCFFRDAIFQSDGKAERREVVRALKDALALPLEELRAKRYANAMEVPNQWTFEQLIGAYFTGGAIRKNGDVLDSGSKGFIEAVKQTEALPALEKTLAEMEDSIQYGAGD
jgi:hypothetical protein